MFGHRWCCSGVLGASIYTSCALRAWRRSNCATRAARAVRLRSPLAFQRLAQGVVGHRWMRKYKTALSDSGNHCKKTQAPGPVLTR